MQADWPGANRMKAQEASHNQEQMAHMQLQWPEQQLAYSKNGGVQRALQTSSHRCQLLASKLTNWEATNPFTMK